VPTIEERVKITRCCELIPLAARHPTEVADDQLVVEHDVSAMLRLSVSALAAKFKPVIVIDAEPVWAAFGCNAAVIDGASKVTENLNVPGSDETEMELW